MLCENSENAIVTAFTRRGSQVQVLYCPPGKSSGYDEFIITAFSLPHTIPHTEMKKLH